MRQGGGAEYDLVSASGDASLRLIYGGDVQPIDVKLIPDWKDFVEELKAPPVQHAARRALRALLRVGPQRAVVEH